MVAVRVFNTRVTIEEKEVLAELMVLPRANHQNIVRYVGHCKSRGYKVYIVYELMTLGSLDHYLFDRLLYVEWNVRMRTALGVISGLVYLHDTMRVVHGNIKPRSILLDHDFNPKITKFGMAWECKSDGLLLFAWDIYCFGVLLIQLFTGKWEIDQHRPPDSQNIIDWITPLWKDESKLKYLADSRLGNSVLERGLQLSLKVAKACVQPHETKRPHAQLVESMMYAATAAEITEI